MSPEFKKLVENNKRSGVDIAAEIIDTYRKFREIFNQVWSMELVRDLIDRGVFDR